MVKCPECGSEVSPEERFCGNCGAPMPQGPEVSPIDEPMDTEEEEALLEPIGGETIMSEPVTPSPPFEPVPPPSGMPAYTPPPLSSTPPLPPPPAAKNKNTTWIIIVIVVVVLLLCCCCIAAVAFFLSSEQGIDLLEEMGLAALPFLTAAI